MFKFNLKEGKTVVYLYTDHVHPNSIYKHFYFLNNLWMTPSCQYRVTAPIGPLQYHNYKTTYLFRIKIWIGENFITISSQTQLNQKVLIIPQCAPQKKYTNRSKLTEFLSKQIGNQFLKFPKLKPTYSNKNYLKQCTKSNFQQSPWCFSWNSKQFSLLNHWNWP